MIFCTSYGRIALSEISTRPLTYLYIQCGTSRSFPPSTASHISAKNFERAMDALHCRKFPLDPLRICTYSAGPRGAFLLAMFFLSRQKILSELWAHCVVGNLHSTPYVFVHTVRDFAELPSQQCFPYLSKKF